MRVPMPIWVSRMRWDDLLFAHWPVDPDELRAAIDLPDGLELDRFDGRAWLGVVPFTMAAAGIRGLPSPPTMRAFPELNVRTYVRHASGSGILFLSLDATSRLMVLAGRRIFHVPYHLARISMRRVDGWFEVRSERLGGGPSFEARYRPTGPAVRAAAGSFDRWSTDRARVYALDGRRRLWRTDVTHAPWSLRPAEATLDAGALVAALGITLPEEAPRLAFSTRIDVLAGLPRPAQAVAAG